MTKLRFLGIAAAAGLAIWGVSASRQAVHAATGYSAAEIKGTYGFTEQGGSSGTPLVGLGLMNADGNGYVSGTETIQVYGQGTQTRTFQGTYVVNPDGTGTVTMNFPPPPSQPVYDSDGNLVVAPEAPPEKFSVVLVNNKLEFRGIRAENGVLVTAEFTRQ